MADAIDDKTLLDLVEAGTLDPRFFRRAPDGVWEFWSNANGAPSNRWVQCASLREAMTALKGNNDSLAAKRAAAKAARDAARAASEAQAAQARIARVAAAKPAPAPGASPAPAPGASPAPASGSASPAAASAAGTATK